MSTNSLALLRMTPFCFLQGHSQYLAKFMVAMNLIVYIFFFKLQACFVCIFVLFKSNPIPKATPIDYSMKAPSERLHLSLGTFHQIFACCPESTNPGEASPTNHLC